MSEKKYYTGLDIEKVMMALLVVAIHTHPLEYCTIEWVNKIYAMLSGGAVPFFFVTSGFLLGRKINPLGKDEKILTLKLYLRRIFSLYIIWTVIYLPLTVWGFYIEGKLSPKMAVLFMRNLVCIGENYNSWHLWYLLSVIYSVMFLIGMSYLQMDYKWVWVLSFLIFVVACSITAVFDCQPERNGFFILWSKIFRGTGRLFYGPFYMVCGIGIRKKLGVEEKISNRKTAFAGSLLVLVGAMSYYLTTGMLQIMSRVPLAAGLVCVGLLFVDSIDKHKNKLRIVSMVIYFTHMWIWSIYNLLRWKEMVYGLEGFCVSAVTALMLGIFIAGLKTGWVKHLFGA